MKPVYVIQTISLKELLNARRQTLHVIAHRYESGSMATIANHPFSDRDKIFTNTMMTVAAIDRLVHHGIIMEIQAESFRKKQAMERNPKHKVSSER